MKLDRLIRMSLNETYSEVHIGKQGDGLSMLLFNFALENAINKVKEKMEGLKFNRRHKLLVNAEDVNLLRDNTNAVNKKTSTSTDASKEADLEVHKEKTTCCCVIIRMQDKDRKDI
jgi:hypothetical protein